MRPSPLLQFLLCSAAVVPAAALALEPLSDTALSRVRGGDGMSFNLSNFAVSGTAQLRYTTAQGDASFSIANLAASRTDNTDAPFADPYRLDVVAGAPGRADIIRLAFPQNTEGREIWNVAYDLQAEANGISANIGSIVSDQHIFYGGGMEWTTPVSSDGLAFGLALRSDTGSIALRPNGRSSLDGEMRFDTVRLSAADSDGNALLNTQWRIADVSSQPGIFNARADGLHLGIDWPDSEAAIGQLQIGKMSFRSDSATPAQDFGSARIGVIQLQYLDIKFRQ